MKIFPLLTFIDTIGDHRRRSSARCAGRPGTKERPRPGCREQDGEPSCHGNHSSFRDDGKLDSIHYNRPQNYWVQNTLFAQVWKPTSNCEILECRITFWIISFQ